MADEWIEEALRQVFPAERDERRLIRQRLDRRLRGQQPPYPARLLRSLYAALLRAGFSSAIIRSELFARARQELPEELDQIEDEPA